MSKSVPGYAGCPAASEMLFYIFFLVNRANPSQGRPVFT
jgi:hypothetical protein